MKRRTQKTLLDNDEFWNRFERVGLLLIVILGFYLWWHLTKGGQMFSLWIPPSPQEYWEHALAGDKEWLEREHRRALARIDYQKMIYYALLDEEQRRLEAQK